MAKEFEEDPFKDYMRTEEEMLKARKTEGKETALATMEAKDDAKVLVGEGLEGDLDTSATSKGPVTFPTTRSRFTSFVGNLASGKCPAAIGRERSRKDQGG